MTQRFRLGHSAIRSANDVLQLALDPEMRWKIGDVCKYGYEWPPGKCQTKAFAQRPVKVRHERHNHVWLRFLPMPLKHANRLAMTEPNRGLQDVHQLLAAKSPAAPKHPVVVILDSNTGIFLENIQFVE